MLSNPKYINLTIVGNGGMGTIYKAVHADLGVPVVIKEQNPDRINPAYFGYDPLDSSW